MIWFSKCSIQYCIACVILHSSDGLLVHTWRPFDTCTMNYEAPVQVLCTSILNLLARYSFWIIGNKILFTFYLPFTNSCWIFIKNIYKLKIPYFPTILGGWFVERTVALSRIFLPLMIPSKYSIIITFITNRRLLWIN